MIPVDLLNYQLIRMLGSGGMGEVYLARNKNIDQYVAVKAMRPKYGNNPMIRARFKQEAVMLNSLNHPNIVKFINFVENEYGVFLIMEYVEGYTLEDYINKKNGLIVEEKAYPMMEEILKAFSYAHQHGIIHRDIKPNNIFIDKEGHIKILDFGIAQIISEADSHRDNSSMGTPAYMSPEQVYGQKLDQRSDIYSLGVLFHQMLTGRAPYNSTTMSELEIKRHVVNEKLPRLKNYYPYISDGLQQVIDKATSKNPEERYANCDEMFKAIKQILAPEKKSKMPLYTGIAAALVCAVIGLGLWNYFRTSVSYYKDYAEYYGVAKGIGSLSGREVSHREMSYRVESSRWKVRRITLVNAMGKPIGHKDTEHQNLRYTDVFYYYSDNGKVDYKKVYDAYGKLLYKIDYDENLKVAMFKHDDEHGTAKRLQSNTTQLYNVDDSERSSITRHLLTYNRDGLLAKVEYASGEDNVPVGDADNIYGQTYSYDEKGRITEVRFLGQDGNVRGNKIGLAIKKFEYDDDDNWTQVKYLSANGDPSHDGNNCPLVKLEYDKWGNRISECYYTIDGKPSYRTDASACGFIYEYDDNGNNTARYSIDGNKKVMTTKNGYAQERYSHDENGFLIQLDFLDKNGEPTYCVDDNDNLLSTVKFTVDNKGLNLSISYYDTQGQPMDLSSGFHKLTRTYDSVGNCQKESYFDQNQKAACVDGFQSSIQFTYNDQNQIKSASFYDKDGQLTYNSEGVAQCLHTYDKMGNVIKYENLDKDGKTLINNRHGYAVTEIEYDALGNMKSIRNYDSYLKPCMTAYGHYAKEFTYDAKTNFMTEEKIYNANGNVKSINRYTYDGNGNQTSSWTVNGSGTLQGVVRNSEYDANNRQTKIYYTNLSGRRVNLTGESYCEMDLEYDDRGNVTKQTYLNVNGKPAYDSNKTYQRIKEYDERNNYVYEKNLGKDGKPVHGHNVNTEGRVVYDERGNIVSLTHLDGYGNPCASTFGYCKLERKYNENNLLSSECYKDTKGNLTNNTNIGFAKITLAYDSKRNKIEVKYFNSNGTLVTIFSYSYNDKNSQTEVRILNAAGKQDDSKYNFSKINVTYAADGVTPVRRSYLTKGGMVLGWQSFNKQTGEWRAMNY